MDDRIPPARDRAPRPDPIPHSAAEPRRAADAAACAWPAPAGAAAYGVDLAQRSVLFLETLRRRANAMLDHERAGLPPVLRFEAEEVARADRFDPPSNYRLLRILAVGEDCLDDCLDPAKPPVLIIDPRAGHGAGIGGFKDESEVGVALHEGYPVYFVVFDAEPVPGQTLGDVLAGLHRFVDIVAAAHDGRPPILYGNCQGGWAAALLAADCASTAGPVVMNGSPLSYWSGEAGANPMRLAAGFLGGAWLTHFLADLGHGRFDGAWLVQNFEALKPETAILRKYADLFMHVDGGSERFLTFERWWSGFYRLSREEMLAIVENLFVGNRLEEGAVALDDHCTVDLRRMRGPVVVFASYGDNITPPHQALGWIPAVYPTTDDLVRAGQRIVYLTNAHAGHLGIFVSGRVARFEHRAILEAQDAIAALPPGLYEMRIDNPTGDPDCGHDQYRVRFEPRRVEDLSFPAQPRAFERVRHLSETLEAAYAAALSPWVRAAANPWAAEALKWAHPMRASRLVFSEQVTPAMAWVAAWAPVARAWRWPTPADDPIKRAEGDAIDWLETAWRRTREARDAWAELAFSWSYDWPAPSPWLSPSWPLFAAADPAAHSVKGDDHG
ncbi:poly(3-hydroxyalkanoate) synthetase [Rhodothalassium salexigens]|uniref:DUF3141 domain-containing protein n=1 Tax=Rhodothalassium salexigens TaxID=1086 RepID=UPI0019115476|nr:DUF3141 domain-containing protein [Rhodothalassium salexigens]MBK5910637.1 poly(3-hydroxyalkanoate) synthetase [Rhodothalassium salexigens]MBK5920572.1 poly(3-hydroxyalkanoate) synthetase [Rhodothalassium salexigens]